MQNKTFQKPKPDKRPAFSFSKIQTLSSLYQLPPRSNPQQTNRDLLPQTHSKASKDTIPTIPTDSSIKTHHTHRFLDQNPPYPPYTPYGHTHKPIEISFLRPTAKTTSPSSKMQIHQRTTTCNLNHVGRRYTIIPSPTQSAIHHHTNPARRNQPKGN